MNTCGKTGEYANGNGALMRILPACLWVYECEQSGEMSEEEALDWIRKVTALTHNHFRAQIASGIYYFMVKAVLDHEGTLQEKLQKGVDNAVRFYGKDEENIEELAYYA